MRSVQAHQTRDALQFYRADLGECRADVTGRINDVREAGRAVSIAALIAPGVGR
jgi:hypothetical protein